MDMSRKAIEKVIQDEFNETCVHISKNWCSSVAKEHAVRIAESVRDEYYTRLNVNVDVAQGAEYIINNR